MTQKLTRRAKRGWAARQSMTGPEMRAALELPVRALVTATVACSLATAAVLIVADDHEWPASMGFLVAATAAWVCLFALSRYTLARRRRCGLVQVRQSQFDLLLALLQVPPEHILKGGRLHDELVSAIADPQDRDGDVAAIETRMRRLVDGAPTAAWPA